jgi:hypothetical protein
LGSSSVTWSEIFAVFAGDSQPNRDTKDALRRRHFPRPLFSIFRLIFRRVSWPLLGVLTFRSLLLFLFSVFCFYFNDFLPSGAFGIRRRPSYNELSKSRWFSYPYFCGNPYESRPDRPTAEGLQFSGCPLKQADFEICICGAHHAGSHHFERFEQVGVKLRRQTSASNFGVKLRRQTSASNFGVKLRRQTLTPKSAHYRFQLQSCRRANNPSWTVLDGLHMGVRKNREVNFGKLLPLKQRDFSGRPISAIPAAVPVDWNFEHYRFQLPS